MMLRVLHEDDLPLELTLLYDGYCWGGYPVEVVVKQLTYMRDTYYGDSHVAHIEDCTACMLCELRCPDFAIEVLDTRKKGKKS